MYILVTVLPNSLVLEDFPVRLVACVYPTVHYYGLVKILLSGKWVPPFTCTYVLNYATLWLSEDFSVRKVGPAFKLHVCTQPCNIKAK